MRADYCPIANEPCQSMCLGDCCLRKGIQKAKLEAELRRLSSELADCKAAYESQFKELHALKASIGEPVAWIRGSGLSMLKLENGGCATVFASEGMSNYSIPPYRLQGESK